MTVQNRRNFIRHSSAVLAGSLFLPLINQAQRYKGDLIRVGIIGAGSRGTGMAALMNKIQGFQMVACCDVLPQNLENCIKTAAPSAKGFSDYRKILEDKSIDAVLIATPLFLHAPMAGDALKAGKHVYLEKAMAFNVNEVLQLTRIIRDNPSLVFQLGYQYRYFGLYKKIKEIIQKNWLGKITHIESQYNRNSDWRNPVKDPKQERIINWRMYKEYCGGPLSELCSHQIDMINYLLDGHPLSAVGMGGINYWKDGRTTFDHIRAIYDYTGGIKSSVHSTLSNAYNGYNIKIYGDRATVEIQREEAFIYAESTNNERGMVDGVSGATLNATTQGQAQKINFLQPGEKLQEPTAYALTDFRDCILQNRKPVSGVDNGITSAIAIIMGNQAAETGDKQLWLNKYSI